MHSPITVISNINPASCEEAAMTGCRFRPGAGEDLGSIRDCASLLPIPTLLNPKPETDRNPEP